MEDSLQEPLLSGEISGSPLYSICSTFSCFDQQKAAGEDAIRSAIPPKTLMVVSFHPVLAPAVR